MKKFWDRLSAVMTFSFICTVVSFFVAFCIQIIVECFGGKGLAIAFFTFWALIGHKIIGGKNEQTTITIDRKKSRVKNRR